MKYKLKKDLPFAKAGAEVILDKGVFYFVDGERTWYLGQKIENNLDDWIEEVRPREWWIERHTAINQYEDNNIVMHETKPSKCGSCDSELINVQEIIK